MVKTTFLRGFWKWIGTGFIFLLPVFVLADLPQLNIARGRITVSGLSSGAFMAVQLEVAYSSLYSGAAVFAGGVYGCAQGSVVTAQVQCMANPESLHVEDYVQLAKNAEGGGRIDPLSHLSTHRVYVYTGTKDTTVAPQAAPILANFYRRFVPLNQIVLKNDIPGGHAQPTTNWGNPCDANQSPWISNCHYDGAGVALSQLYARNLNPPVSADPSHLYAFDQRAFAKPEALMGQTGYIYVPAGCAAGNPCALHVALHGCKQSPDNLGDVYRVHGGYNEWAESNGIVILYPSARASTMNPNGCWDWWGYTGNNYLTKAGAQMKAVTSMAAWVARLQPSSNIDRIRRITGPTNHRPY